MNYSRIRPDVIDSINLYVEHGCDPGGFLTAVLENDLRESFSRADEYNRSTLFEIVSYCWNEIPSESWGSHEKVDAWVKLLQKRKAEVTPCPE